MTVLSSLPPITPQKTALPGAPAGVAPSLARFLDLLAPDVAVALPDTGARQEPTAPGKALPEEDAEGVIDPELLFVAPPVIPDNVRPFLSPSPSGVSGRSGSQPDLNGAGRYSPETGLGWGVSTGTSFGEGRLTPEALPSAPDTQPGLDRAATELSDSGLKALTAKHGPSPADRPHPNPSPEGDGLSLVSTGSAEMPAKPQSANAKHHLPTAPTSLISTGAAPQIATAARVFAQAIHRAVTSEDPRPSRAADPLALPTATADLAPHAITASGDAQHAALDMAQRDWPGAMIARIETLREAAADAANAADTRIRLVPDALGTIDVSLRTEGETVHVHFAAEQAQTRALLADAHARLTELADARGLKLSQSGVDAGVAGGSGQPPRPPQPTRATPDAPSSAEPVEGIDDYRIA